MAFNPLPFRLKNNKTVLNQIRYKNTLSLCCVSTTQEIVVPDLKGCSKKIVVRAKAEAKTCEKDKIFRKRGV